MRPNVLLRQLRFTTRRLQARPDTADLAPPLRDATDTLARALAAADTAEEDAAQLTADLAFADSVEDDAFARVARAARLLVEGNLDDRRWRTLFAAAPSALTDPAGGPAQATAVARVLNAIAEDPALASLAPVAGPLAAAREEVAAIEARRAAQQPARASARLAVELAASDAQRALRRVRPLLQLRFESRAQVASFFVSDGRRGGAPGPEAAPDAD